MTRLIFRFHSCQVSITFLAHPARCQLESVAILSYGGEQYRESHVGFLQKPVMDAWEEHTGRYGLDIGIQSTTVVCSGRSDCGKSVLLVKIVGDPVVEITEVSVSERKPSAATQC